MRIQSARTAQACLTIYRGNRTSVINMPHGRCTAELPLHIRVDCNASLPRTHTNHPGILKTGIVPLNPACRHFWEISSINWEVKRYGKWCGDFRTNSEGNGNKMQPYHSEVVLNGNSGTYTSLTSRGGRRLNLLPLYNLQQYSEQEMALRNTRKSCR